LPNFLHLFVLKVCLHWQSFFDKLPATASAVFLDLATLGDATQAGLLLFVLHHPKLPSQVKLLPLLLSKYFCQTARDSVSSFS
jgi:hypothetical protein